MGGKNHGEVTRQGEARSKEEEEGEGSEGRTPAVQQHDLHSTARARHAWLGGSAAGIVRQAASALAALLLLVSAVPARADDPGTLADRLAQVQQEQARQQQRLSALQGQQGELRQTLAVLQAQLVQSNADLAPIAARARAIEAQLAEAQLQFSHDQLAYLQHLRAFQADIRKLYALGGIRWLEFVFSARSFDDLMNRTIYLQQISVSELQLARRIRAERDALDAQRQLLAQARAELAPLLDTLQTRANAIAGQVASVANYDSQLDSLRRQTVIRLAGLQNQSRKLQQALDAYETEAAQAALRGAGASYAANCPPSAPAGSVRFCGHGWGHGVGLGQWGAKGMALAGPTSSTCCLSRTNCVAWARCPPAGRSRRSRRRSSPPAATHSPTWEARRSTTSMTPPSSRSIAASTPKAGRRMRRSTRPPARSSCTAAA